MLIRLLEEPRKSNIGQLPKGTPHQWSRFLTPEELVLILERTSISVQEMAEKRGKSSTSLITANSSSIQLQGGGVLKAGKATHRNDRE
ncbi:hypothetical protein OPV22_001042 [Ensete ventricosum]|uniref:HTH psq-type domain-containing protein n=1 Tax=Ensete ventricosum TaxID=4639 RepID=A0AAV8RU60_ENSVE|nr:hypothetical protein OPV22_001042 [Ensete ventricosum]